MSEDLPKQELLLKLLKMTTSSNDGEALAAVRKANTLLTSAGWDWDKLIEGKIKVVADPFKSVETPVNRTNGRAAPPPPPPPAAPRQPAYQARPAPPPPPRQPTPPPPPPPPFNGHSTRDNIYAGWCYCCGIPVDNKAGWIIDPSTKNRNARSKWQILCNGCNNDKYASFGTTAAPRRRQQVSGAHIPGLNDI